MRVPIGTVRSRLSQARTKLATALVDTADLVHDDVASLNDVRRREAEEMLAASRRGAFADAVKERWRPDAEFIGPDGGRLGDQNFMIRGMESDLAHGVRQRIVNVVSSGDLMIWEAELINSPENPDHCPPGVVWLHVLRDEQVRRFRLFHPAAGEAHALRSGRREREGPGVAVRGPWESREAREASRSPLASNLVSRRAACRTRGRRRSRRRPPSGWRGLDERALPGVEDEAAVVSG